MDASLATIRQFLVDYYNDDEITRLCFDHFHEVYRNFAGDTTVGRKALQLVDYCHRRDRLPELLEIVRQERSEPFRRIFGRRIGTADRRVNINTATPEELRNLPGIGPALVAAIVEARPFGTVEDLGRVWGIGPRRFSALRGWCVV